MKAILPRLGPSLRQYPIPGYDAGGQPMWMPCRSLAASYAGAGLRRRRKTSRRFSSRRVSWAIPGIKNLFVGCTAWAKGDQNRARERFEKLRRDWEPRARDHPNDPATRLTSVCFMPSSAERKRHCAKAAEPLISSRQTSDRTACIFTNLLGSMP